MGRKPSRRRAKGRKVASQPYQERLWFPGTPHIIGLMITASQLSDMDTLHGTIHAKLWVDAFWLPSQNELDQATSEPRK